MAKKEKKADEITVVIKEDVIAKIKDKFGDKVSLEKFTNNLIENYLACEDAIKDIIEISKEASTAAIQLEKALSKADAASEGFKSSFYPAMTEIPQMAAEPVNTEVKKESDDLSVFKKATVLGRRAAKPEDFSSSSPVNPGNVRNPNHAAQNTGINPAPKPQTVRIGMGPQQNVPRSAVKSNKAQALDLTNAKAPATPVKNLLEGDPSQVPTEVQQQLAQMRSKPQTVTHPTGVIGPDMAKEVMVQPGQGFASM